MNLRQQERAALDFDAATDSGVRGVHFRRFLVHSELVRQYREALAVL